MPATKLEGAAEAADFLQLAMFGGTVAEIEALDGQNAAAVLQREFSKPFEPYLPRVAALYAAYDGNGRRSTSHRTTFWNEMVAGDDPLRQRMVFALSQILVVSDRNMGNQPVQMAHYMDVIGTHAFGNYRDLLEAVTYSPAMGEYLTYRGNRRGDPRTGRTPDENYARELMQLFTIGLVELDMDGTPRLGADGEPVETYTNDDILGLARVFTGLDLQPREDGVDDNTLGSRRAQPMRIIENRHSQLEKSFLGTTIPAGTPAAQSIDQALDAVFAHPNVAPFVSRQLIQRFSASHPEPAYVRRVAEAFDRGSFTADDGTEFGDGRRGSLEATLAAILLDPSQHWGAGAPIQTTTDLGKVREPVLSFVHWARAFDVQPPTAENEWVLLFNARDRSEWIGQMPWSAESVFNDYRPGFVAAGTESGAAGLSVPEFQLLLSGNRAGFANMMTQYAFDDTSGPNREAESFAPDYSAELALADDPEALAERLDMLLLAGGMEDATRQAMLDGVGAIPIRDSSPEATAQDRFRRVGLAVTIATTAPEFTVR